MIVIVMIFIKFKSQLSLMHLSLRGEYLNVLQKNLKRNRVQRELVLRHCLSYVNKYEEREKNREDAQEGLRLFTLAGGVRT